MKVRNDFVKIKVNKREYIFHNLILDTYLDLYARNNVEIIEDASAKAMNYCLLKFDNKIQFNQSSKISNRAFDIGLFSMSDLRTKLELGDVVTSKNQIITNYNYSGDNCFRFNSSGTESVNLQDYINRKITAIAFCSSLEEHNVFSILDVSDCDITIVDNMKFEVKRRDIMENDMIFYSENVQVTYPVHLSPCGIPSVYGSGYSDNNATIYSIRIRI